MAQIDEKAMTFAPSMAVPSIALSSAPQALSMPGVPYTLRMMLMLATRLNRGSLTVVLPDGRRVKCAGLRPGPSAELVLHDASFASQLLRGGGLAAGEAYMDGDFDSPDLAALIELAAINGNILDETLDGKPWVRQVRSVLHWLNRNSRRGSRRNISHHYDLGNDFYRLWLDDTMTYSSALFAGPGRTLEQAQTDKYLSLADRIGLRAEHSLLEIGTGWGGFACCVAKEIGCSVTTVTISREQFDYAARRVQQEGLSEKIDVRLCDYRDVQGRFDRIASIEMVEAVGEQYWPLYFGRLHDFLTPGGIAGLQVITIDDRYFETYRRSMDFVQRYIFPGGMLPSPSALRAVTAKAGFRWLNDMTFGIDYAETLAIWRRRFCDAWPEVAALGFDERFRRMWEFYLCYCEGGFRAGTVDVAQIALARD